MPSQTEPKYTHDVLIYELDMRYNRERITFTNPTGGALSYEIGAVLIDNGDGTFQRVANADATPSGDAILAENVNDLAGSGEVDVWAWVRGPVIIDKGELDYSDASAGDITAIDADLKSKGILLQDPSPMSETKSA